MQHRWNIFGTHMQYQAISWMPIEKYVAPKGYLWNSYETQGRLMVHLLEIYGMSTAYALMPSQKRGYAASRRPQNSQYHQSAEAT